VTPFFPQRQPFTHFPKTVALTSWLAADLALVLDVDLSPDVVVRRRPGPVLDVDLSPDVVARRRPDSVLDGIDLESVRRRKRYRRPTTSVMTP